MKTTLFTCLFLMAFAANAQSGYILTTSGTLIATGGDGTSCTAVKVPGTLPAVTASCSTGGGGITWGPAQIAVAAGKSGASAFSVGDITCMLGMNATAAPVTLGSLGSVGVNTAILACSVNIRTNGAVTSNQAVPNQTITWP